MVFRAYLGIQPMEHLAAALKRGGIKDLVLFFPPNKRDDKALDEHFRKAGLPQIAEWWTKRQYASLKDDIIKQLQGMLEHGDSHADIVMAIRTRQEEQPLPESELVSCIWQGLISSIEWSARQDQNEALALREITVCPQIAPCSVQLVLTMGTWTGLLRHHRALLQRAQN